MTQNGSDGVRSPEVVLQGGSITVNVGPNDRSVDIALPTGERITTTVESNKDAVIAIPAVPPGTVIWIAVGTGETARVFAVEVIAVAP